MKKNYTKKVYQKILSNAYSWRISQIMEPNLVKMEEFFWIMWSQNTHETDGTMGTRGRAQ